MVLGRCAEEVLADGEGLISICVRADLDFRVKRTPLCRRRPWTSSSIRTGSGGSTMTSTFAKVTWAMPNFTIWWINSARLGHPQHPVDILEHYIAPKAQFDDRPAGE